MFKTKIKIFLLSLVVMVQQIVMIPSTSAATLNVRAYGTDTVAGYPSLLKSSMLAPGKKVVFVVEKPDTSIVQIPAQADLEGVAKVDLYGNQTKKAGVYKVAIYYPGTKNASPQNTFAVYPDQVSKTQSVITSTSRSIEADGSSKSFVTVTLYDANKNPVPSHQVKLISSLSNVKVDALNGGVSDKQGRVSFKVTSKYKGVSTFTPIDVTANTILEVREEIVFRAPTSNTKEIGGNYFTNGLMYADILNDQNVLPGPVASFDIEDVPASVQVNTDQTITIVAKDKDGNIAKNYTGTIVISTPNDDNAVLPNNGEYAFKEADQGKFTFNLALRFSQMGNQTIEVMDKANWNIKGNFDVNVTSGQVVNQPNPSASLAITSPLDGAVFGTSMVTLSGKGDPNVNLSVFVDDMKVADTETDTDGLFTYQVTNLVGGAHSFYVMSGQGQVSDAVNINIDTLPPVLNSLKVTPDGGVTPGKMLNIVVNSEPNLANVQIRLQGAVKELLPVAGQPGSYAGNLAAPAIKGNFPLDVVLMDELSNKSELLNQKTISVQNEVVQGPGQVQGVEGVAGDREVMLSWQTVTGGTTNIASYNIYYGTSMNKLDKVTQTLNNSGLHKISGLTNGVQHYFAVTAVDSKGAESAQKSQLIAVTPMTTQMDDNIFSGEPMDDEGIDLFDFDLYGSASENNAPSEVVNTPQASLYNNPLSGVPSNNGMALNWQPFPGIDAKGYKVYFGLKSGQYDDYILAAGNQTTVLVPDLINNIPYYFAVVAIDAQKKEISPLSAEFVGTPSGTGFHAAANPNNNNTAPLTNFQLSKVPEQGQSGSAATWMVVISIIVAGGFYFMRKKFLHRVNN